MMMRLSDLPVETIRAFCREHPVRRLALFGSVLRDDFTEHSDVDVLVEFSPDAQITYFDLFDMQETLTGLIGRRVDLLTPGALSPYFRDRVLSEAVTIYEHG